MCDCNGDDGTRRQSGNTSGDRLLSGDVRVSASLDAERQSAMVGSSATRLDRGGDFFFFLFLFRESSAKLRAGVAQCSAVCSKARRSQNKEAQRSRAGDLVPDVGAMRLCARGGRVV